MLEEKVKKILTRSGWYEGRKIDVTKYIEVLENNGYTVFDTAKRFIEEFGELFIMPKYLDFFNEEDYDEHTTCFEEMKCYYDRNTNYNDKVGELTIPVCRLYSGEYIVCISESGNFFVREGMWAKDVSDFWNGLLGEYQSDFLDWTDYKLGKEFKSTKKKNKLYY